MPATCELESGSTADAARSASDEDARHSYLLLMRVYTRLWLNGRSQEGHWPTSSSSARCPDEGAGRALDEILNDVRTRHQHRVRSVDLSHVAFTLGDSPLCHERGIRRTESVVACGDERPAWNSFPGGRRRGVGEGLQGERTLGGHHLTLRCWSNIRGEDVAVRILVDVEIEVRRAERREWPGSQIGWNAWGPRRHNVAAAGLTRCGVADQLSGAFTHFGDECGDVHQGLNGPVCGERGG